MSNTAGQPPLNRKVALAPVCLAFLAAPVVWAVLYWILRLPAGTLLQGLAPAGIGWLLLQAVLVYPILEEIIFRGALQGWLLERPSLSRPLIVNQRFKPSGSGLINGLISIPNLLASLAFTALHFINQPPLWAALVFIPSLVFGWAREHSGGLVLPILLHIWYNAGFYFLFVQF